MLMNAGMPATLRAGSADRPLRAARHRLRAADHPARSAASGMSFDGQDARPHPLKVVTESFQRILDCPKRLIGSDNDLFGSSNDMPGFSKAGLGSPAGLSNG